MALSVAYGSTIVVNFVMSFLCPTRVQLNGKFWLFLKYCVFIIYQLEYSMLWFVVTKNRNCLIRVKIKPNNFKIVSKRTISVGCKVC